MGQRLQRLLKFWIFTWRGGFSLVEVLVAAAILSTLALVITSMMSNASKAQKNLNETQAVQEVANTISLILTKSDSCSAAFVDPPNENQFKVSKQNSPASLQGLNIPVGTSGSSLISLGNPIKSAPSLKVESISLANLGRLKTSDGNDAQQVRQETIGGNLKTVKYNLYAAELKVIFKKDLNAGAATQSMGSPVFERVFSMTLGFRDEDQKLAICNQETSVAQLCQSVFGGVFRDNSNVPKCHIPKVISEGSNGFEILVGNQTGMTVDQNGIDVSGEIKGKGLVIEGNVTVHGSITAQNTITGPRIVATNPPMGSAPEGPIVSVGSLSLNCPGIKNQYVKAIVANQCLYETFPALGGGGSGGGGFSCGDLTCPEGEFLQGITADCKKLCKSIGSLLASAGKDGAAGGSGTAGSAGASGSAGKSGVVTGGYPPNKGPIEVIFEYTNYKNGLTRVKTQAKTDGSGLPYMRKTSEFLVTGGKEIFSDWIQTTSSNIGLMSSNRVDPMRGLILYDGGMPDLVKKWYGPTAHCIPASCVAGWN